MKKKKEVKKNLGATISGFNRKKVFTARRR
jgi:hypothetical protein